MAYLPYENPIVEAVLSDTLVRNLLVGIIPFLILAIFFIVAIRVANRRRSGDVRHKTENMLNSDAAANLARNKEIGSEFYFTPDLTALPISEYSADEMKKPHPPCLWQKKVVELASKKMLRFDRQYSNLELKQMFGPSNLEFAARYEENFSDFIHAMRHWAEALIGAGKTEDAQKVLEASVAAGSELSQSYTLLGDIYAAKGDFLAVRNLKNNLQAANMPGKAIAMKHLDKLINDNKS